MREIPNTIRLELEDCSDVMVEYVESLQTHCNELAAQVVKLPDIHPPRALTQYEVGYAVGYSDAIVDVIRSLNIVGIKHE